jgi:signal transduction histidine kinase
MNLTVGTVAIAVVWAVGGGIAAWLVTWPLRRRAVGWLVVSVAATGTAASFGALLGGMHTMLLPMGQTLPLVLLSAAAGAVALVAAVAAGRHVTREHRAVSIGLAQLAAGSTEERTAPASSSGTLIEQLNRTSDALARSRERERALEGARRELITWISHDLRTPLAGLRAMSEALEDDLAPDPHLYYKQMTAAVERLSGMVDDLFELSRVQAGVPGQRPDRVDLDLGGLATECTAGLEPLAVGKGVDLRIRIGAAATVRGSDVELRRALTNVIANAIRHTPTGSRVDVNVVGAGSGITEIAVHDECGGITAEVLPRVFDVGYRGDPARGAADRGGGLGLAITRGIVEAHRGSVSVTNTGNGCCFRLRLPADESIPAP